MNVMQCVEERLSNQNLLSRSGLHYFPDATLKPYIQPDDHLPFYEQGMNFDDYSSQLSKQDQTVLVKTADKYTLFL